MVNYTKINVDAPLSDAFQDLGLKWAAVIVSIGGITALVASTLCSLLGQPRIYYQMAKDGLLPKRFAEVHPRTQVPTFSTLVTCISASLIAFIFDLDALSNMISIGTLLAFTMVCGSVIILRCRQPAEQKVPRPLHHQPLRRYPALMVLLDIPIAIYLIVFFVFSALMSIGLKVEWPWWSLALLGIPLVFITIVLYMFEQPNKPTTFQCPYVPLLPLVGLLFNTFIIFQLVLIDVAAIYRVIGWCAIGMCIYFGYGIHHSKLNNYSAAEAAVQSHEISKLGDDIQYR